MEKYPEGSRKKAKRVIVRPIKLAISIFFWLGACLGRVFERLLGRGRAGKCIFLYYHGITRKERKKFAKQMDDLLRWAKPVSIEEKNPLIPAVNHVGITFDDGLVSTIENGLPELLQRKIPSTVFIPAGCLGQTPEWLDGGNGHCQDAVMTAAQMLELARNETVGIGSHSLSHSNLESLGADEARREIFKSKAILEKALGREIKTLSFPYGSFSQRDVEWAKEAGYERVFSIIPKSYISHVEEYVIGRVHADPNDWRVEFRLKIAGAYSWLPAATLTIRKIYSILKHIHGWLGIPAPKKGGKGLIAVRRTGLDDAGKDPGPEGVHPRYHTEVDSIGKEEWTEILQEFDDASIYQTWSYGGVRWGREHLSHLVLRRGEEIIGAAQVIVKTLPIIGGGIAYLPWGPMWRRKEREIDPGVWKMMLRSLREEYVRRRGLFLRLMPNVSENGDHEFAAVLQNEEFERNPSGSPYRTFLVDLQPSTSETRKRLDQKWRNQLNRAEKNGLEVIEGSGEELYKTFLTLQQQMMQRKEYVTAINYEEFGEIQKDLPENAKMKTMICEQEKKPVAAVVCSAIGDTGIYLLGATGNRGLDLKGSYLLQWKMMEWLKKKGCRWYDLGGIDPEGNPGVYHFKAGMGGKDVSYIGQFEFSANRLSRLAVRWGDQLKAARSKRKRIGRSKSG